jgi:hypothetical protein
MFKRPKRVWLLRMFENPAEKLKISDPQTRTCWFMILKTVCLHGIKQAPSSVHWHVVCVKTRFILTTCWSEFRALGIPCKMGRPCDCVPETIDYGYAKISSQIMEILTLTAHIVSRRPTTGSGFQAQECKWKFRRVVCSVRKMSPVEWFTKSFL